MPATTVTAAGADLAGPNRFAELDFEAFRRLACDPSLSRHEKVGFPDSYREGKEDKIFSDLLGKLVSLHGERPEVLEIGPGCSALPLMLADWCGSRGGRVGFVDSEEMLAHLPDADHVHKHAGAFPAALDACADSLNGRFDTVLAYSVLQYVFAGGTLWTFVDRCLAMLAEGGELLLGDIPNCSMRRRFLSSSEGLRFHRRVHGEHSRPQLGSDTPEPGQIDDAVVFELLARARARGFHAWVLPQAAGLPFGNRREDILIRRP